MRQGETPEGMACMACITAETLCLVSVSFYSYISSPFPLYIPLSLSQVKKELHCRVTRFLCSLVSLQLLNLISRSLVTTSQSTCITRTRRSPLQASLPNKQQHKDGLVHLPSHAQAIQTTTARLSNQGVTTGAASHLAKRSARTAATLSPASAAPTPSASVIS